MISRLKLTPKAEKAISTLKEQYGDLLFYQSGGCCEGSQPLLYKVGQYRIGLRDVCIGEVLNIKYYMSKTEFNYWQYSELTIDTVPGVGVGGFSLETTIGETFVIHTRLFDKEELAELENTSK